MTRRNPSCCCGGCPCHVLSSADDGNKCCRSIPHVTCLYAPDAITGVVLNDGTEIYTQVGPSTFANNTGCVWDITLKDSLDNESSAIVQRGRSTERWAVHFNGFRWRNTTDDSCGGVIPLTKNIGGDVGELTATSEGVCPCGSGSSFVLAGQVESFTQNMPKGNWVVTMAASLLCSLNSKMTAGSASVEVTADLGGTMRELTITAGAESKVVQIDAFGSDDILMVATEAVVAGVRQISVRAGHADTFTFDDQTTVCADLPDTQPTSVTAEYHGGASGITSADVVVCETFYDSSAGCSRLDICDFCCREQGVACLLEPTAITNFKIYDPAFPDLPGWVQNGPSYSRDDPCYTYVPLIATQITEHDGTYHDGEATVFAAGVEATVADLTDWFAVGSFVGSPPPSCTGVDIIMVSNPPGSEASYDLIGTPCSRQCGDCNFTALAIESLFLESGPIDAYTVTQTGTSYFATNTAPFCSWYVPVDVVGTGTVSGVLKVEVVQVSPTQWNWTVKEIPGHLGDTYSGTTSGCGGTVNVEGADPATQTGSFVSNGVPI